MEIGKQETGYYRILAWKPPSHTSHSPYRVSSASGQADPPPRVFPAHAAAALTAAAATIAVQCGWPEVMKTGHANQRLAMVVVLTAATAYLVLLALFHSSAARWDPRTAAIRRRRLGRSPALDLTISAVVVVVLAKGHQSAILALGLWIVPPALLMAAAISAVVALLAWLDAVRQSPLIRPPQSFVTAAPRTARAARGRLGCADLSDRRTRTRPRRSADPRMEPAPASSSDR